MQQVWRKRWRNTGWLALGALTLVLLAFGVHKKNRKVCNGISVSFNGDGNYFVDEKGVATILKANGVIKGLAIEKIDLKFLEERLKKDKWIANADLFFDNKQVLQVLVEEKEPVARIFTTSGSSFYIDSTCRRLPLSDKLSARIPMFTNFPSERSTLSKPDSALLASVKDVALFIQSDEFWKAQVSQVDITPGGFEIIPTVGNHVVSIGNAENLQQKFDRLFTFYKQVWTKVGFERYEKVDVQFNGQVVATVKGAKSSIVDTTKAREACEKLLNKVKKQETDTAAIASAKPVVGQPEQKPAVVPVAQPAVSKVTVSTADKAVAKVVSAPKRVMPKPAVAKAEPKKDAIKSALTDEEEAIRKEALQQQLVKQQKAKQDKVKTEQRKRTVVAKPAPKAVLKKVRK
jgi:cell division protein FtsQ